ncbi:MAG: thioredoxin domain-containing protein [Rhodobiaceae bacterium]|nr:thioredoxin domain-containing protein [Rhodobiaceae bacterium]MCC0049286.1 thioredoxin domain-containing protein [Rhodobiaceae bacterium]
MNRLKKAASPYLLQHASNPVDWWPWGPEALAEARNTGKPILLSIGYAACHWCHVMAHESFENESIAKVMNRHFINIKVDREERPDIDQLYMTALHMLGQQGGWPLTMFLTSDARPFSGGTYFPPEPRHGRPGFPQVLEQMAAIHRNGDPRIEENAKALMNALSAPVHDNSPLPSPQLLSDIANHLLKNADPVNGGLGQAPKFPNPSILDFLWRHARTGNEAARDHVVLTLRRMCLGGIYDHIRGGFCRYSVDERWLVPHFEKMLYDTAQLIPHLARAWAETGDDMFRERIVESIDWLDREMWIEGAGYASSLDADSEGEEGAFYVWTPEQVETALGSRATRFCALYDITDGGNFEGRSIPNLLLTPHMAETDKSFAAESIAYLRETQDTRVRPARDDKILTDWNALAVTAKAVAGTMLGRPDWLEDAENLFAILTADDVSAISHSRLGEAEVRPAMATDYANLADAALTLYAHTGKEKYLQAATALIAHLENHYVDESGKRLHLASDQADDLVVRTCMAQDDAIPNHNATYAQVCAILAAITGEESWRSRCENTVAAFAPHFSQSPAAHLGLATALEMTAAPVTVSIFAAGDRERSAFRTAALKTPEPSVVLVNKDSSDKPHAVVCVGQTCSMPISEPGDVTEAIRSWVVD